MSLLSRVARSLDEAGIGYALIGAAAMAVHGVSRSTWDFDVLTTERDVLRGATWKTLVETGVAVDLRHGDSDDPLAGVVRFTSPGERDIDVIVGRSAWQRELVARSARVAIGDASVPVVRASDLVLLKLYAGGPQDAWDIEQLLAAGERASLQAEVESALPQLPVECRKLWERIVRG